MTLPTTDQAVLLVSVITNESNSNTQGYNSITRPWDVMDQSKGDKNFLNDLKWKCVW